MYEPRNLPWGLSPYLFTGLVVAALICGVFTLEFSGSSASTVVSTKATATPTASASPTATATP